MPPGRVRCLIPWEPASFAIVCQLTRFIWRAGAAQRDASPAVLEMLTMRFLLHHCSGAATEKPLEVNGMDVVHLFSVILEPVSGRLPADQISTFQRRTAYRLLFT
jgi:hypothetical protein